MKRPTSRQLSALIDARTADMEPAMMRAYLSALDIIREVLTEPEVLRRIASGVPTDVILSASVIDASFQPFTNQVERTIEKAFDYSTPELPPRPRGAPRMNVTFNRKSPSTQAAFQELEEQILSKAKREVREVVRLALTNGAAEGTPLATTARQLREVIGLTPYQEGIVQNFRRALLEGDFNKALGYDRRDKRFDRTLEKGEVLSKSQIDDMTAAYRRKFVAEHANTVVQTATLNAYRAGQKANIERAIEMGIYPRSRTGKVWITAGDGRVRLTHRPLNGEKRHIDQKFSNGLDYPNEWRCRCKVRYYLIPLPPARGVIQ